MSSIYLLFEVASGVYLLSYMISFFIERNFVYSVFLLLQTTLLLLLLNFSLDFVIQDFSNLSQELSPWIFKNCVLLFYIIFVLFFFFNFKVTVLNNKLLKLNYFNGIFEYLFLTFIVLLSGFLFISSNDLLFIYVFLEVQSLTLYILAAFDYDSARSTEASLKYFIFGSLFSGLFLMGWIFLFFSTGLSNLYDMYDFFSLYSSFSFFDSFLSFQTMIDYQMYTSHFGLFFIVLAILGKLGLFPFYQWIVDVYDSISNNTLFFFSIFPKLFLVFFLIRFYSFFNCLFEYGAFNFLFALSGLGSILVGCLSNLSQWKLKRFLAFSSIVNLGYILLFFTGGLLTKTAVFGILFNLFLYIILMFSFFANFLLIRKAREYSVLTDINELFSLKTSNRFLSISLFINMLSMAGVPPLLGFYGKFYLMSFLWLNSLWFSLAVVLLGSILSAFYYIRIARSLFNFTGTFLFLKQGDFFFNFLNVLFVLFQIFFIFILFYYMPIFFQVLS